jgi:hypothetical protein
MPKTSRTRNSFRVPNSVIQGITTSMMTETDDTTGLSHLTAVQMVTLFGMLTLVSAKRPMDEVRTTESELLNILEVSRRVGHVVDRQWETTSGVTKRKRYAARRRSPKHFQLIHQALLALHQTSVIIRRKDRRQWTDRVVHVLDSFGYVYERGGKVLDLHNLPQGKEKINIGTDDRPVWRIVQNTDCERADRPSGILFRLNTELANEMKGERGTIGYTLIARKVFPLFKTYMKTPAAIRLIILILRQRKPVFSRLLRKTFDELGFDNTHPQRGVEHLTSVLTRLKMEGLINTFEIGDLEDGRLVIDVNRNWYQEDTSLGEAG